MTTPSTLLHVGTTIRQYINTDPPKILYSQVMKDTDGTSSVVWRQQMEKACIRTYLYVRSDRPDPYYATYYTVDFENFFRSLQTFTD